MERENQQRLQNVVTPNTTKELPELQRAGRMPQESITVCLRYPCALSSAFTTGYIWRQDAGLDRQWV